jgi:hypothetical protein
MVVDPADWPSRHDPISGRSFFVPSAAATPVARVSAVYKDMVVVPEARGQQLGLCVEWISPRLLKGADVRATLLQRRSDGGQP